MKCRQQRSKARKQGQTSAPAFYQLPNPLEGLDAAQRRLVIREIAEEYGKQYEEALSDLKRILHQHSPLHVLSLMSYYNLKVLVDKGTGITKREIDPDIFQFHIEFLQGMCLQIKADDLSYEPVSPAILEQIHIHVKKLYKAHNRRQVDPANVDLPTEEKYIMLAQQLICGFTQNIRNWGYFSQVKRIIRELYSPFDKQLLEISGFSVSDVINVFDTILSKIESRSTTRLRDLANLFRKSGKSRQLLVKNYHLLIGLNKKEANQFIKRFNIKKISWEELAALTISHYDLQLPSLCTFSSSDIAQSLNLAEDKVAAILDKYAFEWGALSKDNIENFYLSNPVWAKPVIKLGDARYFCVLPVNFFSFVIPCIESLLSPCKAAVSKRLAEYLESKVAEIVMTRFPNSKMKRNFKWVDNGRKYETDLIVFVDSFALVIECKSGRITPPALQGAPDRLRKSMTKLLIDPNLQSQRLKKRLEFLISNPDEMDSSFAKIGYDLSKLHKIIRISICFQDFGPIQSCLPQLKNTGWLPADFEPCPTMSLADFDTVLDILEHPVQILHYMIKREMIEASIGYLASETGLLGLYLDTLLDIGNLECSDPVSLNLTHMSSSIDNYYDSIDAGIVVNKPRPKISSLFASILSQLEQRKVDRWMQLGVVLNMFSPDAQVEIMQGLAKIKKNVNQNWKIKDHDNMLIYAQPKVHTYALAYVMLKNENAQEKKNSIENAVGKAIEIFHAKTIVIIVKNIDRDDMPYHTIILCNNLTDLSETEYDIHGVNSEVP